MSLVAALRSGRRAFGVWIGVSCAATSGADESNEAVPSDAVSGSDPESATEAGFLGLSVCAELRWPVCVSLTLLVLLVMVVSVTLGANSEALGVVVLLETLEVVGRCTVAFGFLMPATELCGVGFSRKAASLDMRSVRLRCAPLKVIGRSPCSESGSRVELRF